MYIIDPTAQARYEAISLQPDPRVDDIIKAHARDARADYLADARSEVETDLWFHVMTARPGEC